MGVHCKSILLLGTQNFFLTNGFQPAFCGKIFYAKIVPLGLFDRHSCYMSTKVCPIENNTNLNSFFYLIKSSKIDLIFLPAFYMIMPPFSWSIYIISQLIIHLKATYNYSKMYIILWNVGIYPSRFSGYDLKHKKRQNNALITWF